MTAKDERCDYGAGEERLRRLEDSLDPDAAYHDRLAARSLADDLLDALGRTR